MRAWYKVGGKSSQGAADLPFAPPSTPCPPPLCSMAQEAELHGWHPSALLSLDFQLSLANEDNRRTLTGRRTWESEVRFPTSEVTQGWLHAPVQRSYLQGALVLFFSPRPWLSFVLFVPRTIPWPSPLGHGRDNNDALHSGCYTTPVVSLHCALWE